MREVNNQNLWNFELGTQESMKVLVWITIRFQQRDRQDSQNLNNDTFCGLPVVSAQYVIRTDRNPDAVMLLNYDDDDYSQGYGQIKEAFRALTRDDILQAYISDDNFRNLNVRADDVGKNLKAFHIGYQQDFTASQPIKVEFNIDGVVRNDVNGFALVLTIKLVSIGSDGERHFDLIYV